MKKIILLLCFIGLFFVAQASEKGHFTFDFQNQNIKEASVELNFQKWFQLDDACSFELVRDYTDDLGMRHINYQQYLRGVPVEHCVVMLHIRENRVISANGCVMERRVQPANLRPLVSKSKALAKSQSKNIREDAAKFMIVSVNTTDGLVYRPAYKIFVEDRQADVYVDAETGEIIKEISRIYNADVAGTAYTTYNGWQPFTCDYDANSGYYRLVDNGRSIMTVDATQAQSNYLYNFLATVQAGSYATDEEIFSAGQQAFNNFLGTCHHVGYPTAKCVTTYLNSVTIKSTPNNSWWYAITDSKPDIYIVIKDASNKQIYKSAYYSDCTLPLTFDLSAANIDLATTNYAIEIYDYDPTGDDDYGGAVNISSNNAGTYTWSGSSTTGSFNIINFANPALDAHWGMQKTYDFYKTVFNRLSYDNAGSVILQLINPPHDEKVFSTLPTNAFAKASPVQGMWPDFMAYGIGDGVEIRPVVALDVMAHEFTHLVTTYNGNGGLEYHGESGALNESFSDIMGCAVEFHTKGSNANWLIGEDIMIGYNNMRSMSSPNDGMGGVDPSPDTYMGSYWTNTTEVTNDNGGVHHNSGVQNYWFYLLCVGGSGINDLGNTYSVKGIGITDAQKIAYRTLMTYLTPTATFLDARNGSLLAAQDFFGKNSVQYQSVMNAWHAVGVGTNFVTAIPDITIQNFNVYSKNYTLFVETEVGNLISVYSVLGQKLYQHIATSDLTTIDGLVQPIVIVKVGEVAQKIIIQ